MCSLENYEIIYTVACVNATPDRPLARYDKDEIHSAAAAAQFVRFAIYFNTCSTHPTRALSSFTTATRAAWSPEHASSRRCTIVDERTHHRPNHSQGFSFLRIFKPKQSAVRTEEQLHTTPQSEHLHEILKPNPISHSPETTTRVHPRSRNCQAAESLGLPKILFTLCVAGKSV